MGTIHEQPYSIFYDIPTCRAGHVLNFYDLIKSESNFAKSAQAFYKLRNLFTFRCLLFDNGGLPERVRLSKEQRRDAGSVAGIRVTNVSILLSKWFGQLEL